MKLLKFTKMGLTKYFDFSGRTSRQEFWWYYLGMFILSLLVYHLAWLVSGETYIEFENNFITTIWDIFIFIPGISIMVRRLHDVNRSGWWFFIVMTIIGIIPFLYWIFKGSDDNENKYGFLGEDS
jgi:uncharacterized membrane protein YhaH (DUF805 family)|tara:strand:- start:230 stop:604 length:375 start_codon:yes stop_codon:yes gene_type:complete